MQSFLWLLIVGAFASFTLGFGCGAVTFALTWGPVIGAKVCKYCGMICIHSPVTSSLVWSLQALSHSQGAVIGCVCILLGALVFQDQDIQAFQGIALPGSFTDKPDIVRHISDSCTCLAGYTNIGSVTDVLVAQMLLLLSCPGNAGLTCFWLNILKALLTP